MTRYPTTPPKLSQPPLPDELIALIGRMVRAIADVENLVTLYIIKLTNLTESQAVVLLGRLALKSRIDTAGKLARLSGPDEHDSFKAAFGHDMGRVIECRNALTHGIYLGADEKGQFFFRTDKESEIQTEILGLTTTGYSIDSIRTHVEAVEGHLLGLAERLQLEGMLQVRQQTRLVPHRKAHKTRDGAKSPPQQQ